MEIRKQLTINLRYCNAIPAMDVVQGDSGRVVDMVLMDGDIPWEIPQGAAILVQYCCSDGTGGTYDTLPDGRAAYEVTDRGVTVYLAPQVCAVPGDVKMQLTVLDGETQISTFEIKIAVQPKVTAATETGEYTNLERWWSQQGGEGLPKGGVAGQLLMLDEHGYAQWETASGQMVGLENVDNTSDQDKPISLAQQAALDTLQEALDAQQEAVNAQQEAVDALSVDYVVEQGANGGWTYRKWKSGIGEMWGSYHNVTDFTGSATITLPFEIVPWSMSGWVSGYHHNDETASNIYTVMYATPTTAGITAWKYNSDAKSTKASCRIYIKCQWK